jgi:hypothetical protein
MKPEAEIDRLRKIIKEIVPSLDLLQIRLERGEYMVTQDGEWHLFDVEGEGVVSGKNLRELLINLIWIDC